jgi:hypothetical protein
MKTERICWYRDPRFTALVRPPPGIPCLSVNVAMDAPD